MDIKLMDKECTCPCGNKHEAYGGKGYTVNDNSNTVADYGYIHTEYICKVCGSKHVYHNGGNANG